MSRKAKPIVVDREWSGSASLEPLLVEIGSIFRDPANVRRHGERNLGSIKASLKRFGQQRPILVDDDGIIRAGNGTHEAAESIGWTHIAAVRSSLKGSEATAYAIADNRTAELAEWDDLGLAEQLRALQSEDFDLEPVGYTEEEIDRLVEGLGDAILAGTDPEASDAPEAKTDRADELQSVWRVEPGQLWVIPSLKTPGKAHRLLCGDSTNPADVSRVMAGEKAALLVTSPPYNQSIDKFKPSGMHREGDWVAKVERLAYADSMPESEYQEQQRNALAVWYEAIKDGGSMFYNHKNRYRDKQVVSPLQWLPGPFRFRQEIIWSRPGSVTQNARMFLPSDERIYWLYKGDDFYFDDATDIKSYSTVWSVPLETNKDHAVAFPVELPRRCITACSRPGDIVVEPHCGSGTTIAAAEQTGRLCRGIEIAPKYVAVALQRLADMGLEPKLES